MKYIIEIETKIEIDKEYKIKIMEYIGNCIEELEKKKWNKYKIKF